MSEARILVATPCVGETVTTAYLRTVFKLGTQSRRLSPAFDMDLVTVSMADIYKARNYLAALFTRRKEYTHLLFLDSDMGFEPRLISKMLRFDQPFTAALYPFRNIETPRFHQMARQVDDVMLAEQLALDFVCAPTMVGEVQDSGRVAYQIDQGFVRVKAIGTGAMLLRREVFEILAQRYPDLFSPPEQSPYRQMGISEPVLQCFTTLRTDYGNYLSEDVSFCTRWDRCGGKIWACVDEPITHYGHRGFTGAYIERMKRGMIQI